MNSANDAYDAGQKPADGAAPGTTEFSEQWSGGAGPGEDTPQGFDEQWAGGPDDSADRAEQFGEQWSRNLDDAGDSSNYGTTWSGDNTKSPSEG